MNVALLDVSQTVQVFVQIGQRRHGQRQAIFGVQLRECRQQHAADFFGHLLGLHQQTSQTDKCLVIGLAHTEFEPRFFQSLGQVQHLLLELGMSQYLEQFPQQLHVHRADRLNATATTFKLGLFVLDPQPHVLDDRHVFAPQTLQLLDLLCEVAYTRLRGLPGLRHQAGQPLGHGIHQQFAPLADDPLNEHVLQLGQLAGTQQRIVAMNLGNQALLR